MQNLFGKLKMRWSAVVLFALAAGVYTALVLMVPALKGTSFQDIGVSFEWWVVFAVIIAVNCRKGWEAMLKCFVFFLISQPVIYGVQVLCGSLSFSSAKMYYVNTWLPMTLLTLPGGFLAYFCKKQNFFGSAILGLGNTILALMAASYLAQMHLTFPRHILTAIFCIAAICILSFSIQRQKKYRVISLLIPVLCTASYIALAKTVHLSLIPGI